MEKNVVGDYFYSLKAYDTATHVRVGNFLVAKDGSCVYGIRESEESRLLFGSPESLLEKTEVVMYPKKSPWEAMALSVSIRQDGFLTIVRLQSSIRILPLFLTI